MKLLMYSSQYADLWAREISYQTYSQQTKVPQAWDNPDRSAYSKEWELKKKKKDFPGSPVVKNLPSSAGDVGSIPGQGTKIPQAVGSSCSLQLESPQALEPTPCD